MKKFLTISALLGAMAFSAVGSAEAKTSAANGASANAPQVSNRYQVRRNGRVVRVTTRTRNVRVGNRVYRETYQTRYLPNGRVTTRLISRTLIRRY